MISIIVPLYNKEKSIVQALDSVLNQTFQYFEILVVDDGSTDNSLLEVQKRQDPRIHIIRKKNGGVSSARNVGITNAKYDYLAFLDADDKWKLNYLEKQVSLINSFPQCALFCTNYEFENFDGKTTELKPNKLPFSESCGIMSNYFEVASCSHPPIWTGAVVVKKSSLQKIGGFPIGIKMGEDLITWARLAINNRIAYCNESHSIYTLDMVNYDKDQKTRMPDTDDYVGKELVKLYINNPDILGLKDYVSLWFRMRGRIYLEKNLRLPSMKECVKSLKWRLNVKTMAMLMLNFFPYKIVKKVLFK